MSRKMILMMLALLLVFGGILMSADQESKKPGMKRTFKLPGQGPGYNLLRTLADDFGKYAGTCEDSLKIFMEVSDKWIAMADKAKARGDIDEVFFQRYKRLAIVCKLVVIPDKQRILSDLIVSEINKFAGEPLGKDFQYQGIGSVASKMAKEILSLKAYLDDHFPEFPRVPGNQAGYKLLDSMSAFFNQMVRTGNGEADTIIKALNEWMAAANKAKTDGKIDQVFFKRFKRIVVVLRLICNCSPPHCDQILNELLVREINQFDIKPLDEDFKVRGIASIVVPLQKEIKSLKKYLDKG